jgi:hypothetical protein
VGFTSRERAEALSVYQDLRLEVFPYDTRTVPFTGWNNPALWGDHYYDLVSKVHTFGVRLDKHTAVVDVDTNNGGDLDRLERDFGPMPPTLTVTTPGGPRNLHLIFRTSVPLRTCRKLKAFHPGIDFLSAGSHIKGATSVRYLSTDEEVMYKLQRPILDPAPLPEALEARWAALMPATEKQLWDEEITEALDGTERQKLARKESVNVYNRIARELTKIRNGEDERRHDVVFRAARDIYQRAVLLGRPMGDYDDRIAEAYRESGGEDFNDLARNIHSVKLWVAKNPIPRPGITAYHRIEVEKIAAWADAASQATRHKGKAMRGLILAVVSSVSTAGNLTTAGESLAKRYPDAGNKDTVQRNLRYLEDEGWLIRDGEGVTELGFVVPHRKLDKARPK